MRVVSHRCALKVARAVLAVAARAALVACLASPLAAQAPLAVPRFRTLASAENRSDAQESMRTSWQATPSASRTFTRGERAMLGFLIGAPLGAGILGYWAYENGRRCGSCYFEGEVVAIAITAGAIGGGTVGALVGAYLWPKLRN